MNEERERAYTEYEQAYEEFRKIGGNAQLEVTDTNTNFAKEHAKKIEIISNKFHEAWENLQRVLRGN